MPAAWASGTLAWTRENGRPPPLRRVRQACRLADLRELPGVVGPVVAEERADIDGDGDLLAALDLLEERDAGLPALELGVAERVHVGEDGTPLGVEGVGELREGHRLALGRHLRQAGHDPAVGQIALGELPEEVRGLPARLEQEMAEHLSGGPLAGRVGPLEVGPYALELAGQGGPALVGLGLELARDLSSHRMSLRVMGSLQRGIPRGVRAPRTFGCGRVPSGCDGLRGVSRPCSTPGGAPRSGADPWPRTGIPATGGRRWRDRRYVPVQ